jgi:hypothetical protein
MLGAGFSLPLAKDFELEVITKQYKQVGSSPNQASLKRYSLGGAFHF